MMQLSTGDEGSTGARALARMCSVPSRRDQCLDQGGMRLLIDTIAGSVGDDVASGCCLALARLLHGACHLQDDAVKAGAVAALLTCLRAHAGSSAAVAAACQAFAALATGLGAASRRQAAADEGAFAVLVGLCARWPGEGVEETCGAACRSALRSLTRDSAKLQEKARADGAEAQWLL